MPKRLAAVTVGKLQMPLKPALDVRETVAGHRLGALEAGGEGVPPPLPMHPPPHPHGTGVGVQRSRTDRRPSTHKCRCCPSHASAVPWFGGGGGGVPGRPFNSSPPWGPWGRRIGWNRREQKGTEGRTLPRSRTLRALLGHGAASRRNDRSKAAVGGGGVAGRVRATDPHAAGFPYHCGTVGRGCGDGVQDLPLDCRRPASDWALFGARTRDLGCRGRAL